MHKKENLELINTWKMQDLSNMELEICVYENYKCKETQSL